MLFTSIIQPLGFEKDFSHCYDHSFPLRSKAPKGMKPRHL